MTLTRVLYLSALAIVFPLLTGCVVTENRGCEQVKVVFKEMQATDPDLCARMLEPWTKPPKNEDQDVISGNCFRTTDGSMSCTSFDPCEKTQKDKWMCAEVATALMQQEDFRDSVLRIEP